MIGQDQGHIVVIGASAGGHRALTTVLSALPPGFSAPIVVVQHLHPDDDGSYVENLDAEVALDVVCAFDKQAVAPGCVHVAPANYHLLLERDWTLALSTNHRHKWSRPAIDVLFESAAYARHGAVIAVLLSGANDDGAAGMMAIRTAGGVTVAQDPSEAAHPEMPSAAIHRGAVAMILAAKDIGPFLRRTVNGR